MQKEANKNSRLEQYEEIRKRVRQFHLTSDILFCKVMEDKRACQELIQILTGENLEIRSVKTQYSIRNLENHSVVLDVLAEDERGRLINVEIHPREDEDHVKRVRYHLSSIDTSLLEKGQSFEKLPDVYLIYITRKDFIGKNRAVTNIHRVAGGNEVILDNGVHEIYVNLEGQAEDVRQKELIRFIVNSERYHEVISFPNLADRVRFFKEKKEGIEIMCEVMYDIFEKERAEGRAEGRAEAIKKGIEILIADNLEEQKTREQILVKLVKHFSLSRKEAEDYLKNSVGDES